VIIYKQTATPSRIYPWNVLYGIFSPSRKAPPTTTTAAPSVPGTPLSRQYPACRRPNPTPSSRFPWTVTYSQPCWPNPAVGALVLPSVRGQHVPASPLPSCIAPTLCSGINPSPKPSGNPHDLCDAATRLCAGIRAQGFDSCLLVSDLQGNEYPSLIHYVHQYMYRSYLFVWIFFVWQSKRIC
jgi:hypothetical protein